MSRSEFRYNKKRKHYSYSFKKKKNRTENILLTSKSTRKEHQDIKKNVKLYKHPNPNMNSDSYVIPKVYLDDASSFDERKSKWKFHPNDKRKIKRIKKNK